MVSRLVVYLIIIIIMLDMKFSYKIIVLLFKLSVLAVKCDQFRTIAGEEVDIKKAPYTVSTSTGCGGALIKPQWVLSAAHCFLGLDWKRMTIGLGAADWKKTPYNLSIEKVYVHPKFQNRYSLLLVPYDIAIVKLAKPAVLSESVQLLQLEETNWPAVDKRECTLAGFGQNIYKNTKLHMSKYNFTQGCMCVQNRKYICYTTPDEGDDSPCYGDSGSVVVCDNKGVAIMSHFLPIKFCTKPVNETLDVTLEHCKNSLHLCSYMKPHLEWFKDTLIREPDTHIGNMAIRLTMKDSQYYGIITMSVQLFALLIIFSSYFG